MAEAGLELADAARRAFGWIGSLAVDVDGGLGWLEDGALVDDLWKRPNRPRTGSTGG